MLVSSLARSSASSLMVLLLLWATLVFAIPNAGNLIAEQISPLPSTETQEMLRRQQFAKNRFLQIQSRQDSGRGIAAFNREYDRLIEDYRARLDAMTEISKLICRVSPAATLSYVYADLAGTGLSDQRQLTRGLLEFKNRTLQARGRGGLAFEFRPRSLAQVLAGGALVDLALLATACLAAFAAAVAAFLRTDPR
jgi:hypothetical protein